MLASNVTFNRIVALYQLGNILYSLVAVPTLSQSIFILTSISVTTNGLTNPRR